MQAVAGLESSSQVPAGQGVQTRSVVAEGVWLTYVPAVQVVHAAQLTALFPVLNAPDAHAAQLRLVVAFPASNTY